MGSDAWMSATTIAFGIPSVCILTDDAFSFRDVEGVFTSEDLVLPVPSDAVHSVISLVSTKVHS